MNWKLILSLSPFGVFMGTLMVLGIGNPWIIIFWTIFSLITAYIISKKVETKWILTCLIIGTIWGLLHNIIESIFFDFYLINNPGFEGAMSNPDFIPARYFVLITGPFAGFATGILLTIFTWVIKKLT